MEYRGAILKVDLTTEKVSKEPVPSELCQKYLGGEGINSWLLWEHYLKVKPGIEPTSKDNVLIGGVGPLGAVGLGAACKMKWTFKSPLTGMFGDSSCGGGFPAQLRWAGYDHLIITGKAKHPVYLRIDDDLVEIRDAANVWGKDVIEADDKIKEELGDNELDTVCIARSGENLVSYTAIISGRHHAAARTGGGCVMGSKNLKAISARGDKGIPIYNPEGLLKSLKELIAAFNLGTVPPRDQLDGITHHQELGCNPYRNDQRPPLPEEKAKKLSMSWYRDKLYRGLMSCPTGCITGCLTWHSIKGDESLAAKKYAGEIGCKLEYVALLAFGVLCDIPDLPAVIHLSNLCNNYSLDLIEVGATCSLLMELWQRGLITEKDTAEWMGEPLSLEWGNYEAVEKIMESIVLQNNKLGNILKGGVYKTAQRIEELKKVPALKYALYGKGGSAFCQEIRHTPSWALNMATASRGADHQKSAAFIDRYDRPDICQHYFGTSEISGFRKTNLRGVISAIGTMRAALYNCLGICCWSGGCLDPIYFPERMFADALFAATGTRMSAEELWKACERTANLEKAFNSRLGYRREDDKLCHRWMKEKIPTGPAKGWKAEDYLEQLKDEYYEHLGWDKETSLQTRQKLQELGMGDIIRVLEKENAVI